MNKTPDISTLESSFSHPLEMIPLFRRWPVSLLRDIVYTGIWNTAIAVVLAATNMFFSGGDAPFSAYWWPSFLISNLIGFLIHGSTTWLDLLLRGWPSRSRGLPRVLYFVALLTTCAVLGIAIGSAILQGHNVLRYLRSGAGLAQVIPFSVFVAFFVFTVLVSGERRLKTEALVARQNEQIAVAAKMLAEARLRALQAQIEPHFLYNTLANVVSLIGPQPQKAQHMLERFIDYLRASLDASRADQATLGAEVDLISAYLDVLAVRMGARLRYRIEINDALRALPLSPMLLQPIVENAIIHGIEPKIEGGEITLRAQLDAGVLCITISDTGVGLAGDLASNKPGGGVGMSNLRERLQHLYGSEARVELLENLPCGFTARLLLPVKGNVY